MTLAVLLNGDGRGDLRTVGARVSASRRGRDDDALVLRRYRSADHDAIWALHNFALAGSPWNRRMGRRPARG